MWESSWLGIATTVAANIAHGLEHGLTARRRARGRRSLWPARTSCSRWSSVLPGYRNRRPWRAARMHAGCRSA